MFEHFTPDARAAVARAQEQARRLGHPYIGGEHLLLALAASGSPAGGVLREQGVTGARVEGQLRQLIPGTGKGQLGSPERDALASIGIDLDEVRARIETTFGPGALTRPRACRRPPAWRRGPLARLRHRPGQRTADIRPAGHLPLTPRVKKVIAESAQLARTPQGTGIIGAEHLALALVSAGGGLVPVILSRLAVPVPQLRAALAGPFRQAS